MTEREFSMSKLKDEANHTFKIRCLRARQLVGHELSSFFPQSHARGV